MMKPGEFIPVRPSMTTASGTETTAKHSTHRGVQRERHRRVLFCLMPSASIRVLRASHIVSMRRFDKIRNLLFAC